MSMQTATKQFPETEKTAPGLEPEPESEQNKNRVGIGGKQKKGAATGNKTRQIENGNKTGPVVSKNR